jgi:DNA-binding transcriptional MerR regulator
MNVKVLTLFGEEIVPYEPIPAKKPAAKAAEVKEKEAEKQVEQGREAKPLKEKKERKAPKAKTVVSTKAAEPAEPLIEKQYYTIGEVARMFKVNTSHIRFWTNEFALKVRTTRKGDRLYSPAMIGELRTINELVKGKGFTIAGAKAHLKNRKKAQTLAPDIKEALIAVKQTLLQVREQIK